MNSINRFIARIGSALGALTLVALFGATIGGARAAESSVTATYGTQTLRFTHVASASGSIAIGVGDPAFAELLRATGALLTWRPGERYVMITTAVPVVVSFAVGDRRYDVGPLALQASFAPYQIGNEAYLPFDEVLRALDLALRRDASGSVLQPQLASLDVQSVGDRVALVAHGGAPLRPRIVAESASAVSYEFDGVGTTLAPSRVVNGGGVRSVEILQSGTARDPKTLVTVELLAGATHDAPRSNDDRDVVLGFSGSGASGPAVAELPTPVSAPVTNAQATYIPPDPNAAPAATAAAGPALVTGVSAQPSADGTTVTIAVTGNATYEWHRLRDPDNRFWIDITGAQLNGPPTDQNEPDPLISVRVRQVDPTTVRVAISLAGQKQLDVSPSATGVTIDVGRDEVADALRQGIGSIGATVSANEAMAPVTPAPLGEANGPDSTWKFGGGHQYVPTNPRLIVIDPGHGGSDIGAAHGSLTEAGVNLDMAKRLRDILISRGWQVRMTRDTDIDVYQPNDTAHEELQARDDIANNAGARLLVSIHANSFINSGPYGTTTYISKPSDVALAAVLRRHLAADLGTKDDGVIKSHLYITLHALMPAALIETAFLSNPGDYALLSSSEWRQKVAESIADGIDDYTRAYPAATQGGQ